MKTPITLLLTDDPQLEETFARALSELGALSHLARTASEALETAFSIGHDLDLAVIDFDHGSDRISLLHAMSIHCNDLPIVAVTPAGAKHLDSLACASGARVCLHKPVSIEEIAGAIKRCRQIHEPALVA